MSRFEHYTDFWGTYEGSHDGRRARLEIGDTKADVAYPLFRIVFEDLDRNETYRDTHGQRTEPADGDHVLTDVELDRLDGDGSVRFRKFLLHTWDTDYLTGISVWDDREFGASFERVD